MKSCVKTGSRLGHPKNEVRHFVNNGEAKNDHDVVLGGTMFATADVTGGQRGGGIAGKLACGRLVGPARCGAG